VSTVWQVVKALRPHPLAVGQARSFCASRLSSVLADRAGHETAVADAAAIASELVTNAVAAGSSVIELSLALHGDSVRVAVSNDAGGTAPVARRASGAGADGNGAYGAGADGRLGVVAALARDWGIRAVDGTKDVWADVMVPPRSAGSAP
jgi:hypothetical protein